MVNVDLIRSEDQIDAGVQIGKDWLEGGRWALNSRDSNRLDPVTVAESVSVGDDETAEIAFPTWAVPTDGAN